MPIIVKSSLAVALACLLLTGIGEIAGLIPAAGVSRNKAPHRQTLIHWKSEAFPVAGTRSLLKLPHGKLLTAHTAPSHGGLAIFCAQSEDQGRSWKDSGVIASDPEASTDIGDGSLLRTPEGVLYYAYRHNHHGGAYAAHPDYAVRVAVSRDNGESWQAHSTVRSYAVAGGDLPSRGLWAPFLFETPGGRMQCYYDDEKTPFDAGFRGHQWLMMQQWNPQKRLWENPVVVSRAHDPKDLSRDGMGTVVALSSRRLFCALESVQTNPPHAGVIRSVTSDDGGKTWSWRKKERGVVYQPPKKDFMALAPVLIRLSSGALACIFCTDEDRDTPDVAGTPPGRLNMDIKIVTSADQGGTWSRSQAVAAESHKTYLPGLIELSPGHLLATWVDFKRGGTFGKWGSD